MYMVKHKNLLLLGSVMFILFAVALVAILDRTGSNSTSSDVRARASATNALELMGTVNSVNEADGTLIVDTVYLADENRTGNAQSLGTWTVTAPEAGFNFASVSPGQNVKIGIDAKTFLVENRTVTAFTIIPVK